MSKRLWLWFTDLLLFADAAHAQMAVIDPANLGQTVLIAQRTQRILEEMQGQYRTIMRMSRGLGDMEGFRIPPISGAKHAPERWAYARPWLSGLNSGDPTGAGYASTTVALGQFMPPPGRIPAKAQRSFDRQLATIEVADSVAMMASHQVGAIRQYNGRVQQAVHELEEVVMDKLPRFHEITAILDKVAAGELIGRRQDMAANQLLSHAVEQLLARGKRLRDAEASTMNMQLTAWREGRRTNDAMVSGSSEALRTWRQP